MNIPLNKTNLASIFALKILLVSAVLNITSCSTKDNEPQPIEHIDIEIAFNTFEASYQPYRLEVSNLYFNYIDLTISTANLEEVSTTVIDDLLSPSLALFEDLGFKQEDYEEMLGSSDPKIMKEDLVGSAVLIFNLYKSVREQGGSQMNQNYGTFSDCFLEATGIAAGIAIVGALVNQTGGKALRKAIKKAVKKIGGRVLGGIGLLLIAVEMVYCLNED